jgi:tRNA threonylcarbamoyladenosine biosynthesis protein TsaE
VWADEAATQRFAKAMAGHSALHHAFIELHGTLGAGKTTFVRHLLRALGVQGLIKSPTYAVVETYEQASLAIWHFDFYRFSDPREWEDAGFRDIFASPGLKIAEWPENAASHLPMADLVMRIEVHADETRHVSLLAQTETGTRLLEATGLLSFVAAAATGAPF